MRALVATLLLGVALAHGQPREPQLPSGPYRIGPPLIADPLVVQAQEMEREGRGVDAVKMYIQAARSGNGDAAKRLGEIYRDGIAGVPRDVGESRKWFNAARVLGESSEPLRKPRQ